MKVIHIIDSLSQGGGVGSFVYDLCLALKKQGVGVSLIGILGGKEGEQVKTLRNAGIPVYCLNAPNKKKAILSYIPTLKEKLIEISDGKSTICNLHLKLSVLIGGMASRGLDNIKCVETYHSQYSHYGLEYKLLKNQISKYICCSDSAKKEFIERFRPAKEKVVSIPNGIDVELLHVKYAGLNPSDGITRLISVGRFTDQKNIHVSVKAFSELCNEKLIYNIIGEGPYKEQIEEATAGNEYINLLGTMSRDQVMQEVGKADVVVMPSLWEGLSIFMLEAMSLGKIMMLSDISSFRNVVGERKLVNSEQYRRCSWGYLVQNNSDGYIRAYKDYIALNHKEKKKMNNESYEIAQKFSINATAEKYIKTYISVWDKANV